MGLFVQNCPLAPWQKALEAMHWKWRPQQPAGIAAPHIHLSQQKVGIQKLWRGSAFLGNAETNLTYMTDDFA